MKGEPTIEKTSHRWRRRLWRSIGRFAAVGVTCSLLFVVAFWSGVCWWTPSADFDRPPAAAVWIEDRNANLLGAFVAADGQWRLPLAEDEISPHLLDALVAVEDCRYFDHGAIDYKSVAGAAWENVRALSIRRGASTITMQLARLRSPPRPRGWWAKFEQAVRAEQIERMLTKRQILVEYVNRAPFGGNLVGAGAASWRYFGKPAINLSLSESALLAGLPRSPNRFRPDRFPKLALQRRDLVLDQMLAQGMISPQECTDAKAETVNAGWHVLPQSAESTREGSLAVLLSLATAQHSGRIFTTLDAATQEQATTMARERLANLSPSGIDAIAIVVADTSSGDVLAAVSLCPNNNQLDLTRRGRSTGSVLKPFIYASAFEAGVCQPQTLLRDAPTAWPGYAPQNYDHSYRGWITAAAALARSRNVPAIQVLSQLGTERTVSLLGTAGLRALANRPSRYGLSLAIGGAECSPMELAEAYATIARGGVWKPLRLTVTPDEITPDTHRVWTAHACRQTLDAIADPTRTAEIYPTSEKLTIAWKTGTSSGNRDAWCAAVTRQRTVVVWVGNAHGEGSQALVGADAAAPLAVQLAAALDPQTQPWLADETAETTSLPARVVSTTSLSVTSPMDGTQFILNPDQPPENQRVLLRAIRNSAENATDDASELWWFADGESLGKSPGEEAMWWNPTRGRHVLRVTDEDGHAAQVRVDVK